MFIYFRMLRAILIKSWRQHPKKQRLRGHLQPITKLSKLDELNIQDTVREIRTLISDILLWAPSHGRAKVGRPARIYTQ